MSVSIYGVTGKSIKATLQGEKVELRLARFVSMNNAFFSEGKELSLVRKAESNYKRARPATYFVDDVQGDGTELEGSVVFKVPEGYRGTHKDFETEKFEVVGTLLSKDSGGKHPLYRIETDLNTVEQIRREREFERMEAGMMFIGSFGNDTKAYSTFLKEKDAEAPTGMFSRGHGLY